MVRSKKVAKAKEILEVRDVRLKDVLSHHQTMMKELLSKKTELAKSSDKVLNLERKVSCLNGDLMNLITKKEALKKQAAAFKATHEKAKAAAVSSQLDAKLAHASKSYGQAPAQEEESLSCSRGSKKEEQKGSTQRR